MLDLGLEAGALAKNGACLFAVIPERGILAARIELVEALAEGIYVKAAARGDRLSPAGRLLANGFQARPSP
jgi:hypothetical protein